jgi:hypothetical protein
MCGSDLPRDSIVVGNGPVDVLEGPRDRDTGLGIVVVLYDLLGVDVLVVTVVEVKLEASRWWGG